MFEPEKFLKRVDECVKKFGFCAIVVSEGVRNAEGKFLSDAGVRDAFGHAKVTTNRSLMPTASASVR